MFGSLQLKNRYITVISLICLVIFTALCFVMLRAGAPDTVEIGGESYTLRAGDEADIAAFVKLCGCELSEKLSERGITVPKHWNDLYTEYNELQRQQGFDLVPYKGKSASEAVYAIADSEEFLTLLISDGRIIAAHICGADGGDMKPLINGGL